MYYIKIKAKMFSKSSVRFQAYHSLCQLRQSGTELEWHLRYHPEPQIVDYPEDFAVPLLLQTSFPLSDVAVPVNYSLTYHEILSVPSGMFLTVRVLIANLRNSLYKLMRGHLHIYNVITIVKQYTHFPGVPHLLPRESCF